jgi:hypothetical protein
MTPNEKTSCLDTADSELMKTEIREMKLTILLLQITCFIHLALFLIVFWKLGKLIVVNQSTLQVLEALADSQSQTVDVLALIVDILRGLA